jgi:hypothetical protein
VTSSKRPWWQVTRTPKYGFILSALWAVMAVYQWMVVATGEAKTLGGVPARAVLAALMTLLAAVYLVSTVRLRRRLRAARKDESELARRLSERTSRLPARREAPG